MKGNRANLHRVSHGVSPQTAGEYADAVQKYFQCYDEKSASEYDRTMYNQVGINP